jgi:Zn-dependent peptidase ImmA (M78 family)
MQSKPCTPVINNIVSQEVIQNFTGAHAYTHTCLHTNKIVSVRGLEDSKCLTSPYVNNMK